MLYKKFIYVYLILLSLLLVGCKKEPIAIGFTGNLTGTSSEIAIEGMYGTMLAIDEINANGGIHNREIRLIIEDDGNSKETAMAADKRLIDQGVVSIIGHMISGVAEDSVSYINSQKMVMISPTISSSAFSGVNDYFYTMVPISKYQSSKIVSEMSLLGCSSPGYLYQIENEKFSKEFTLNTAQIYEKVGVAPTFIEGYSQTDESSFNISIETIINNDIDALVIAGSSYDVARFAQVLTNKGVKIPIFTSTWAMTLDLIRIAGPAAEGIYTINTFDSSSASENFINFQQKYIDQYGKEPTFASAYAYEATHLLCDAIDRSKNFTGESIKEALDNGSEFKGLEDDVIINEYGDAIRSMYLFKVNDGTFEKVE